jgi:hypothetical protein
MGEKIKQELIDKYGMRFLRSTRHNEIFDGAYCVLIWNRETKLIKIKPKNLEL